jgi:HTH-type transcriptional regulator / antitoxin MqsA
MKCPACDHPQMAPQIKDETLTYGNQTLTLHNMHGDFCQQCGEGIWDVESYRRYTEAQNAMVAVQQSETN